MTPDTPATSYHVFPYEGSTYPLALLTCSAPPLPCPSPCFISHAGSLDLTSSPAGPSQPFLVLSADDVGLESQSLLQPAHNGMRHSLLRFGIGRLEAHLRYTSLRQHWHD